MHVFCVFSFYPNLFENFKNTNTSIYAYTYIHFFYDKTKAMQFKIVTINDNLLTNVL